jgi:CDP-glucose 4,6-dehydratase
LENLVANFRALRQSRILITGHTGFKGSWLTKVLEELGVSTFGLSLEPTENSLYSKLQFNNLEAESFSDIKDFSEVRSWIKFVQPDLIFHLAAQPLVIESYLNPLHTFQTNVIGSANLFEAVRQVGLDCPIVAVTTDKVYKNKETLVGYSEDSPLGGLDPYSASKSAMEMAVTAWRNINSLNAGPKIVSVRSGNVIGGGDSSRHRLLPDIISALHSGEIVKLRNPGSIRPWQHVLDPLMGYLLVGERLLQKSQISEAYNFGPAEDSRLTVAKMTDIALELWPNGRNGWELANTENLHHFETELLWLNSGLAQKELGWNNRLNARESLRLTIDWALSESVVGANTITHEQISKYLSGWSV